MQKKSENVKCKDRQKQKLTKCKNGKKIKIVKNSHMSNNVKKNWGKMSMYKNDKIC